ncbi:transposase [Microtetraspora malaysiensis]|uniref:transposase n=1 Tax=Microtetraspora malaysiensis TaxID=161358 RepID=UPI003D8EABD2
MSEHLGSDGVLIVDETGFLQKGLPIGRGATSIHRYGRCRIENSQVRVFLAYPTPRGRALIDRRRYLPEHSWLADQPRCRSAGVPGEIPFARPTPLSTLVPIAGIHWAVVAPTPKRQAPEMPSFHNLDIQIGPRSPQLPPATTKRARP